MSTLAHLSDLHLGKNLSTVRAAWKLREAIDDVDHTVVTGDVTHSGLREELELFWHIFGDLIDGGRLTTVPGNHDRLGDDVGDALRAGPRVHCAPIAGAELLCIDSTSDFNGSLMMPHGELTDFDLAAVSRHVQAPAPLRIALLHHHPVRLPEDSFAEWLGSKLRITQARELDDGALLVDALMGRASMVLHGHRHIPRHIRVSRAGASLDVFNAGSSTGLHRFRVFSHEGGVVRDVAWRDAVTETSPACHPGELSSR